MGLQIVGIENVGNIDNERLVLRVSGEPVANWTYAVLSTPDKPRHAYYFDDEDPYATLIDGDKVYLYTGTGDNCIERNGDQKVAHYYWGLSESVWNKGDKITLLEIAQRTDKNV
ncbi:hypothetical protein [Pseudescherichia sp.]|uniref:hypothetical protein n=1 Tax=Pseudescherichia sp. TaxID=2055881 RepID=UPI002896FF91|nr:hypothetical protein [Pseudescherichia sp.]